MTPLRALGLAAVVLLGGCVYYNGMYNAKRLASSARRAERDGRTFEANNLWGQVITRADTLLARHPDSKYVDEAMVLKGVALARLNQCEAAVPPLGRVALLRPDREVAEDATLALGRCHLALGNPAVAEPMFARVAASQDPFRRREATLLHGRALRLTGRAGEAVPILERSTDPRATAERLLALAGAGKRDEALGLADSLLAKPDSAARWDTLVVAIGRENPRVASDLVDRLQSQPGVSAMARARMLLDDGERLAPVDSARAIARLRQVAAMEGVADAGERARLHLIRLDLGRAASVADLGPIARSLDERVAGKGALVGEAAELRQRVARIQAADDSASTGAPQADLRLFLAAESARDSLGAPALAASLFRRIVESTPDSPYAPKAILAGQALDAAWGETAVGLLESRYATSPYVAYLQGAEPFGYRELEDSLQAFAQGAGSGAGASTRRPNTGRDSLRTRPGAAPPRRGLEP